MSSFFLTTLVYSAIISSVPYPNLIIRVPTLVINEWKEWTGLLSMNYKSIFSSPEPEAHGELIVWYSSRRPSVRASVRGSVPACDHIFSSTARSA